MTRRPSVLLVDDDEDARFLIGSMLRRRGFEVDDVGSATECLAHLESSPSRVVVTDVQMPEISGVDLCRQIRERFPEIVAVVVSGAATPSVRAEVEAAGAFAFLPKPVKIGDLEAMILDAIGAHVAPRASAQSM
jgi:CheY-like chemotaxis protein